MFEIVIKCLLTASSIFEQLAPDVYLFQVCIPQFSMVTKDDLQEEDFKDHILVPVNDDSFQTVSKHVGF